MVEESLQKERVKMIREQVFVGPTGQVFAQICQELIPAPPAFLVNLSTIERGGRREMERPKVGPKGETRGIERVK